MSTTVVLFEDVEPFKDLYFPITFRAQVDYRTVRQWEFEGFEAQGAHGGWVDIPRGHALRPVIETYIAADVAREVIESQIAGEIERDQGSWRQLSPAFYSHAAE